jgi:Fur family ferric uptake transcriptional regulator
VLVMEALSSKSGHVTADEIMRWVSARYPTINLATVYRTLDALASAGLVTQTDLGIGAAYYEMVGDTLHHHLVCDRCGAVTEVEDSLLVPLRERLLRDYDFRAAVNHLAIFGTCRACREASRGQVALSEPEQ